MKALVVACLLLLSSCAGANGTRTPPSTPSPNPFLGLAAIDCKAQPKRCPRATLPPGYLVPAIVVGSRAQLVEVAPCRVRGGALSYVPGSWHGSTPSTATCADHTVWRWTRKLGEPDVGNIP